MSQRTGKRRLAGGLLALVAAAGCSVPGTKSSPAGRLGNGSVGDIKVVADLTELNLQPLDAVPSPDGSTVFFSLVSSPQLYRADKVAAPQLVTEGAGFSDILGISISSDGKTL